MAQEPYTLTARWLFPVDQPPLPRGTMTIEGERIAAVEKAGVRTADIDLGNVAILPGFTNTHTHLDLSDALGKCPPTADFTHWLRAVVAHRRQQTSEDLTKAIGTGLDECLRNGTTLVGDISAGGASWEQVKKAPLRAVVFYELIGLTPERAAQSFDEARRWLRHHTISATCVRGLSPHAPYSTRGSLIGAIAALNGLSNVAIHLAETEAELQLLESQIGPLVDFLKKLDAWDAAGLAPGVNTIIEEFAKHREAGETTLFIHGNYLASAKLPGTLVYCPRTHAAFGHPPHPFREFLDKGTLVALGTDSLASNPDLDLLAEARFVHNRHSGFPGAELLSMATLNGAKALGFERTTGSLSAGKSADFVILPLPNIEPAEPHVLVFESALPLQAVVFRGKPVYGANADFSLP